MDNPHDPKATVSAICFHERAGICFLRDSEDRVYLLLGDAGAPVLDRDSPTESIIRFIDEFPDCLRCIPLRARRRKAVKAAMRLAQMGVKTEERRT